MENNVIDETSSPDVGLVLSNIREAVRDSWWYYTRIERAYSNRMCVWDGQSADGRKHAEDLGHEPFPWEGASDIRPRVIDEIVNEQVMMMWQAFSRGRMQVTGIETSDLEWGEKVSALLRYLLFNKMRGDVRRELSLAAQWRQWYGSSVTAVMWEQELRRMQQPVTVEGLAVLMENERVLMEQGKPSPETELAARSLVMDPLREDEAAGILQQLSELLTLPLARRKVRELRATGHAMIDVPEVVRALPKWTALLPQVEIFFPVETDDIQKARWVAHREVISEADLKDRIDTAGYDEKFVEEAIKHKGRTMADLDPSRLILSARLRNAYGVFLDNKNAIEIFHVYHKSTDAAGLPEVNYTVMNLAVPDVIGKNEPLPYSHGKYPYVVHRREHCVRTILESRGVAEIADTWQADIKEQQDARTNRTMLTTLPPLLVPNSVRGALMSGTVPQRVGLMPGSQLGRRRGDDAWEFMRTPPYDQGSIEIEKSQTARVDRYFGRLSESVSPTLTQLHMQDLTDGWLVEVQEVGIQTLQLCQQYMSDADVSRIVGALPRKWQLTAADIRGEFDLSIQSDARDLNVEMLKEKLSLLNTMVLVNDRAGRVDMSKWIELTMRAVDPWMAEATLVPMGEATENQVQDQLDRLNKMLVGIQPTMQPAPGMNYQLRAQVMQQTISSNPEMQRRIAAQADTAELIKQEMEFLQFQNQQANVNPMIGRLGVQPVMPQQG